MWKNVQLLLLCFIAVLGHSCGNRLETGTDESSRFRVIPALPGKISFSFLQDLVLTPYCVNCHTWAKNEAEVQKRIDRNNSKNSILYTEVLSGRMPQGQPRLNSRLIEVVAKYIEGLKEVPPIPTPIPTPLPPLNATFTSLKVHLLERSCLGCHSGDYAARKKIPVLVTLEQVKENAEDIIYTMTVGREMDDTPMPPKDSTAPVPSTEVINAFKEWMNNNYAP